MARRAISEEETLLWQATMRGVKRLHVAAPPRSPQQPASPRPATAYDGRVASDLPSWSPPAQASPKPQPLEIGRRAPGIDDTSWRGLSRGQMRVERRLDLHGHRAQAAFEKFHRFVLIAVRDNLRCIEIVTGLGSGAEGGVLKRELPLWLTRSDLAPHVLGLVHPHARNQGSVRVLLRRRRIDRKRGA